MAYPLRAGLERPDAGAERAGLRAARQGREPLADAVRGASTLINAIADGRHAAETILARLGLSAQAAAATPSDERRPDLDGLRIRQATRVMGPALPERSPENRLDFDPAIRTLTEEEAMDESRRCLQCDLVCNVCTTVCPNRANVVIAMANGSHQILHVDKMCNECGNCAVFCPYQEGRPYKDKLTLFWSEQDMENSENEGFLAVDEDHFKVRVAGTVRTVSVDAVNTGLPEAVRLTIRAVRDNYSYLLKK